MKTQQSLNFGAIVCLIAVGYVCYYLLLLDNHLPFSIGSVISSVDHWSHPLRVLVIGLLPIYIAFMLFGTAILGIYLGSNLQRWITNWLPLKFRFAKQCRKNALPHASKNPLQVRANIFKKV